MIILFARFPGKSPGYLASLFIIATVLLSVAREPALAAPVNGLCGSANGGNYAAAPTNGLCLLGTPSGATGIGPWFWSCTGLEGGTTASCSAAQAGGIVHKSGDAGVNWTPGTTGLGYFNNQVRAILVSPSYSSDQTLFIAANLGIYKSSDSGGSWTQAKWAVNATSLAASPNYGSDRTIFAGVYNTGVYKSTDAGVTWNLTNNGPGNNMIKTLAISPAYASDHTVYAGLYGTGVYKSTDSGATWSAANTGINTLSILSLVISPAYATDRTIFAATTDGLYSGGGPHYHIYKSIDAGITWTLADSGLSGAITSLAISPAFTADQTLFATTGSGIYKSNDSGNIWTRVHTAASGNSAVVLSPAYASDQTIFASVYNDTVYRSSNGGSSWSPANTVFTVGNRQLVALALSPAFVSDRAVFTATSLAGPYISVSPVAIAFGNVKLNTAASRQVTITNGNGMFGDANLAISAMNLSGSLADQSSFSPGSCGTFAPTIVPGASCSVDITFTPTTAGSKLATLQIMHNDGQHSTQVVSLSGSGGSVSSTIATPVINGNNVSVSGTASCSAGDTVALVEVSSDGGVTWQPASGTTSWSKSLTLADGSYPIKSRATTSGGIVETPGFAVIVTVPGTIDTDAPSGTLAIYNGVWTLNADSRDGQMCVMVYPSICGTVEMSANGVSGWQPATTTPGTGGPLWLRDRAGNTSIINGVFWNSNGGPIRVEGGPYPYFSYLQHALNAAGSGNVLKLAAAQYLETLLANTNTTYTVRGGYDSSHGSVTGTSRISGSLTVQAGDLTMENLEVTGGMTVSGGVVTTNSLSLQ